MVTNRRNLFNKAIVIDLARQDFDECWTLQHRLHRARKEEILPDCLLLVEHPHVLTIGRGGKKENILVSETLLCERGIPCLSIERGGDVIYHGPGQLVGYPIFALKREGIGIIDFVWRLEEVMIQILKDYGIIGQRSERNRGVWVGKDKVGFVGIAVRSGISLHGFALNVNPDLSFFELIQPCGLKEVKATSIKALLGKEISLEEVKESAIVYFQEVFNISMQRMKMIDLLIQISCSKSFDSAITEDLIYGGYSKVAET
jgi:lipoyl(octanoyl) transferase